jgi:hypothetical protein
MPAGKTWSRAFQLEQENTMIKKSLIVLSVAALAASGIALPAAAATSTDSPVQLAMKHGCNPCAAKKGCNPCAAKGCNPCAAKGCNPCAAKGCNPCAAKGCNPCAAKKK